VGAQGGSLAEVCKYGMNDNIGLLINSSRGIIYASKGTDYAKAGRGVKNATGYGREIVKSKFK
jgi:orotidine-5'-phosphate decarboxylase